MALPLALLCVTNGKVLLACCTCRFLLYASRQQLELSCLFCLIVDVLFPEQVGWFLHTPFPSSEIYRTLPVREEVLRAVLKADLIGFHTYDYARHFVSACTRILGLEVHLQAQQYSFTFGEAFQTSRSSHAV